MAEGLTVAGANAQLDALVALYPWFKLHTGAPGATGANNAAAETTRKQGSFAAAASATVSTNAQLQWTNVAGSEDYTHYSMWTASTAGTCGHTGTVTANAVTAADTFTIASGDLDISYPTAS